MSDFSPPEYASYIALVKQLVRALPDRKPQIGDVYVSLALGTFYVNLGTETPDEQNDWVHGAGAFGELAQLTGDKLWLPSLADWLEMVGGDIGFEQYGHDASWACAVLTEHEYADGRLFLGMPDYRGEGPTREEAAARLWAMHNKVAMRSNDPR